MQCKNCCACKVELRFKVIVDRHNCKQTASCSSQNVKLYFRTAPLQYSTKFDYNLTASVTNCAVQQRLLHLSKYASYTCIINGHYHVLYAVLLCFQAQLKFQSRKCSSRIGFYCQRRGEYTCNLFPVLQMLLKNKRSYEIFFKALL